MRMVERQWWFRCKQCGWRGIMGQAAKYCPDNPHHKLERLKQATEDEKVQYSLERWRRSFKFPI